MEDKEYLKDTENTEYAEKESGHTDEKDAVPADSLSGVPGHGTEKEQDEEKEYERFCFLCHRPESQTGKLITLGQGISICPDCMQKTMDTIQNGNIDFSKLQGINMINLSDLQNMMPRQQKVKKKKPKEEKAAGPAFDIRKIPLPIRLRGSWMSM